MSRLILEAGLRSMPLTSALLDGEVLSERLQFEPKGVVPYTDTFRRMARNLAYDIAEMPVATQLLAADAGQPLVAMPIVLAGGAVPHGSLLCLRDADITGPADLKGRRVGIRAYAQTTAVWLRGVLHHEYGVAAHEMHWLATEDSHIPTFRDPSHVERIPEEDLLSLLRRGAVDAIIASPHVVKGATDIRTVIPDARATGQAWAQREGVHTVNHVLAVKVALRDAHPWVVDELARCFEAARTLAEARADNGSGFPPYGDTANRRSIELMLGYAHEQELTLRRYHYDDLFLPWPMLPTPR